MEGSAASASVTDVVRVEGAVTAGDFVVLCDHASSRVPDGFGDLGLAAREMASHIAWDPGALPVARGLAARLGSPLVYPDASRLLVDCNRPPGSPDSIAPLSEDTAIPGNREISPADRRRRVLLIYDAYHSAIAALLDTRARQPTALVAVHSFTPSYRGRARPWHVGIVVDRDRRIADPLLAALRADADLVIGENEPYSPADGVYHTLERHGAARGLPSVMIEVRNDLIATGAAQEAWAARLAPLLVAAIGPRV